ncbi:MAG: hypothetical protein ABJC13_05635 [Acidobacteriota bacterium]
MPRIKVVPRFKKAYKRLPPPVQAAAQKALRTLIDNPRNRGLNLEALSGRPGSYSIRVNRNYRILLQRKEDQEGEFFSVEDVDTHDIYNR